MRDAILAWTFAAVPGALKVIVGPLSGAFAGAWAAQGIAKRNTDTQRRLEELRANNLAISAVVSIVNTLAALKRQQIRPLKTTYDKLVAELENASKTKSKFFEFQADFHELPVVPTALPMLDKLLYDRLSVAPGAMGLHGLLSQSVGNLSSALANRNAIIIALRAGPTKVGAELAQFYFGLPDGQGHRDSRYRDSLNAVALYVDDGLLFGYYLALELAKRAEELATPERKGFPKPARVDFKAIKDAGLLPPIGDSERNIFNSLQIKLEDL